MFLLARISKCGGDPFGLPPHRYASGAIVLKRLRRQNGRAAACLSARRWLSRSPSTGRDTKERPMSQVIALVDDDRNILTSVSIALQQEGFVTRVYSDGVSALKALA